MRAFDRSTLSLEDKQILDDFQKRREVFNRYIETGKKSIFTCPSCGYPTLSERRGYEICQICDWEDDNQDDDSADEVWGGPNGSLSLTESRLIVGRRISNKLATGAQLVMDPEKVISILEAGNKILDRLVNYPKGQAPER